MCYFKLENVSYKYPLEDRKILKTINLDIKKGEFWAVLVKMVVVRQHFVMY